MNDGIPSVAELHAAAVRHHEKLVGLDVEAACDAATAESGLVIVTSGETAFDTDEAELLFDAVEQRIWRCRATTQRLLAWLTDEAVQQIHADELPDVQPLEGSDIGVPE